VGFVTLGVTNIIHPAQSAFGRPHRLWVDWVCVIFFGSGIPLFAWQIANTRPRFVIDENGISFSANRGGKGFVVPWSEITGAYIKSIKRNDFICLEVRNPDQFLGNLSPVRQAIVAANEKLGFTPLSLNLGGLKADSGEILELVLKMSSVGPGGE
jgi:hypothetical protein